MKDGRGKSGGQRPRGGGPANRTQGGSRPRAGAFVDRTQPGSRPRGVSPLDRSQAGPRQRGGTPSDQTQSGQRSAAVDALLDLADDLEEQGRELIRQSREVQRLAGRLAASEGNRGGLTGGGAPARRPFTPGKRTDSAQRGAPDQGFAGEGVRRKESGKDEGNRQPASSGRRNPRRDGPPGGSEDAPAEGRGFNSGVDRQRSGGSGRVRRGKDDEAGGASNRGTGPGARKGENGPRGSASPDWVPRKRR
jgi:hypothetical protein